jgi:hypothetical protein
MAGRETRSPEELLAVAAAEQEGEPFQVAAQLGQSVGGVADELCQGGGQAAGVAGQPLAEELQHLRQPGSVGSVQFHLGHGEADHRPSGAGRVKRLLVALAL